MRQRPATWSPLAAATDRDDNERVKQTEIRAHDPVTPPEEGTVRPAGGDAVAEDGLRFDDPYWDDAFCAWWDPALRTCC